ncbi:MAG: phosphoribosylamine--glycine ligase [Chitinophagaceae bacterium]
MRILLLGSGGREHAIAWKIHQSSLCQQLFIAPGNGGTCQFGRNIELQLSDFEAIKNLCIEAQIDLVFVGPEEPLVNGISDFLKKDERLKDLLVIGPTKKAARLEGSKAFAKSFMQRHNIPTAAYKEFTLDNYQQGVHYLQQHALPIVLKADGLAAGKGVVICQNHLEAIAEFELMIQRAKFGEASKKVVVEDFLEGIELSVFVLTDGESYLLFPEAKDYKRVGEGDTGLNTGGMGAVSPVPFADDAFIQNVKSKVIEPTIEGLKKDGLDYCGFIFFGLMKVGNEPYMIEYNCRLGDPETQVILTRLKSDLVDLLVATAKKQLHTKTIEVDNRTAVTVMAVSKGYPGHYEKGFEIRGLENNYGTKSLIFQAGTKKQDGKTVTNGGRVLCVTSFGEQVQDAVESSLEVLDNIRFSGIYYRTDIGYEFKNQPAQ